MRHNIATTFVTLFSSALLIAASGTRTPQATPVVLPASAEPQSASGQTPAVKDKPTEEQIKNWPLEMRAQYLAGNFIEELPNFIVTENVIRMDRMQGQKEWQTQDKLEIEVTYSHKKGDSYKVLKQNGKAVSQKYEKTVGATSMGEFGEIIALLNRGQFGKPRQE